MKINVADPKGDFHSALAQTLMLCEPSGGRFSRILRRAKAMLGMRQAPKVFIGPFSDIRPRGAKISRSGAEVSLPSLWAAAREPAKAYGEARSSWWPSLAPYVSHGALAGHMLIFGSTGRGQSQLFTHLLSRMGPSAHPADQALEAQPWSIAADEALDASHPMCALAWLSRAREASEGAILRGYATGADLAPLAASLARSMAGDPDPDGLDPAFARGIEMSVWGQGPGRELVELALPIHAALSERAALADGCSAGSPSAPPSSRRI